MASSSRARSSTTTSKRRKLSSIEGTDDEVSKKLATYPDFFAAYGRSLGITLGAPSGMAKLSMECKKVWNQSTEEEKMELIRRYRDTAKTQSGKSAAPTRLDRVKGSPKTANVTRVGKPQPRTSVPNIEVSAQGQQPKENMPDRRGQDGNREPMLANFGSLDGPLVIGLLQKVVDTLATMDKRLAELATTQEKIRWCMQGFMESKNNSGATEGTPPKRGTIRQMSSPSTDADEVAPTGANVSEDPTDAAVNGLDTSESIWPLSAAMERELFSYVFNARHVQNDEIVVMLCDYTLTRGELSTVLSRNWVASPVITTVARIQNSNSILHGISRHIFYSSFAQAVEITMPVNSLTDPENLVREFGKYIRLEPTCKGISQFDWLMVPHCVGQHWNVIAVSVARKEFQILDPMPPVSEATYAMIEHLTKLLPLLMEKEFGTLRDFSDFKTFVASVPEQKQSHDCGVFVIKYLEQWFGGVKGDLDKRDSAKYRRQIALSLLAHPRNEMRDKLLSRCKDKKAGRRG